MKLTDEQEAIRRYVSQGDGDLLVDACAGSGKTASLREALKVIPQRSILVCAFNRKIADDWKANVPPMPKGWVVHVQTFHSIGKSILQSYYPKLRIDKNATETIINRAAEARGQTLSFPVRRAATRLLRQVKETEIEDGIGIADQEEFLRVGTTYELFDKLATGPRDLAIEIAMDGYDLSMKPEQLEAIDFCDMIWLPIALGLTPKSRYQAILIDEWQDISEPQWALLRKMRAERIPVPGDPKRRQNGRLILAGDFRQSVYQFRGSAAATIRAQMLEAGAKHMTLTTSFRCSKAVISEAQHLVPGIKAWDDAPEGSLTECSLNDVTRMIFQEAQSDAPHTFVLSRSNAALLDAALYLWSGGVRFQLNAGKEMLDPLFKLLEQLELSRIDKFRESLEKWHAETTKRCEEAGSVSAQERADELHKMLLSVSAVVEPRGIRQLLTSILEPNKTGVLLSSVHKVKGLEADRVFLLQQTFKPRMRRLDDDSEGRVWKPVGDDGLQVGPAENVDPKRVARPIRVRVQQPLTDEDNNVEYVAITRARVHLIWVDMSNKQAASVPEPGLEAELMRSITTGGLERELFKAESEMQRLSRDGGDTDTIAKWAGYCERLQSEINARAYR